MREIGPVKEPEDEKSLKKKAPKAGFLASWIRNRENSGEPDNNLDEQDLVDPEKDAQFNDGFSKRWHKLFSGTVPVDNTGTAQDDDAGDDQNDDTASLMDAAREQALKSAKPAKELKHEVEEQHDAKQLTDKEITANVPSKSPVKSGEEMNVSNDSERPEDFDVFASTAKPEKKKRKQSPAKQAESDDKPEEEMSYEDTDSTPEVQNDNLPELPDDADGRGLRVSATHLPFRRTDPAEFAHETDIEDNVEAPGAPTKGYRGLLVIDHDEDQPEDDKSRTLANAATPPALPPEPEAFLPEIATPPSKSDKSPKPAEYVLPAKDKWPNPALSRPVIGGTYTGPKLDRHIQNIIDRPVSPELTQLVDTISAINREQAAAKQRLSVQIPQVQEPSVEDDITVTGDDQTVESLVSLEEPNTGEINLDRTSDSEESDPASGLATAGTEDMPVDEQPSEPRGAVAIGNVLKDSPLAEKIAATVQPQAAASQMPMSPTPLETPSTRPSPEPLYTPAFPKALPILQTSYRTPAPAANRYRVAMQRGILGGLAVSAVVVAAILFG